MSTQPELPTETSSAPNDPDASRNLLSPDGSYPSGDVCIPNISTAERRKRLVSGLVAFAIGLAILVALVLTGADRLWRLPLFLLFASGASGFFQWRDKT